MTQNQTSTTVDTDHTSKEVTQPIISEQAAVALVGIIISIGVIGCVVLLVKTFNSIHNFNTVHHIEGSVSHDAIATTANLVSMYNEYSSRDVHNDVNLDLGYENGHNVLVGDIPNIVG